jgi:hypothetical protein
VFQYEERARVTASFGFNYTAPGGLVEPALSYLVIGVRAARTGNSATTFRVSATRLPRTLEDGAVIDSAVAPL